MGAEQIRANICVCVCACVHACVCECVRERKKQRKEIKKGLRRKDEHIVEPTDDVRFTHLTVCREWSTDVADYKPGLYSAVVCENSDLFRSRCIT